MTIVEAPSARERLIETSYELFTRRGIGDVDVDEVVERAGDATALAWSLNILVKGSIVCAAEGDRESAQRAKPIAAWLIDQHRPW